MEEAAMFNAPANIRWNPALRKESALKKIERAIETALTHPEVKFTHEERARVVELMCGKPREHTDDTPSAARGGEPTNASVVRRQIDPSKRYRLKGSGEVVTGAELLRRRGQA
jgi:hypothetical protein